MSEDLRCRRDDCAPARGRFVALAILGAVILGAAFLAFPAPALGADVEELSWPQFQGGPSHAGEAGPDTPPPPYRERWRFEEPDSDRGFSAPIVVGNRAIAVGVTGVYGIDLATGEGTVVAPRDGGPLASPAAGHVDGRSVLVYTEGGAAEDSAAVGVNPRTGKELWRIELDEVSRSGVTIDGDVALVGDDGGELYAVALADGSFRWKLSGDGRIFSPPAVADGRVYATIVEPTDFSVRMVAVDRDATGTPEPLWTYEPSLAGVSASAPSVGVDGSVFVGGTDRSLAALDPTDGSVRWTSRVHADFSWFSAPSLADDVLVIDSSGGLYRLDARSGERVWSYHLNALAQRSSPVLVGRAALIGLDDGRLVAIDVETADLVWQSARTEGAVGAIAAGPGVVVTTRGGGSGGLVAFEADPEGRLTSIPSPTVADYPRMALSFAIALVLATAVLWGGARLLVARFGPFEPVGLEVDEDEP